MTVGIYSVASNEVIVPVIFSPLTYAVSPSLISAAVAVASDKSKFSF